MLFVAVNLGIVFLFRLWFLFLGWRAIKAFSHSKDTTDESAPPRSVSVLIPARNEQANIKSCLEAVLRQNYPLKEIIVIDDGSTDQTAQIVEEMQQRHEIIRLVKNSGPLPGWLGKNYALYRGAQQAGGEYLLFLDADVRISPDCLRTAMRYVLKYNSDLTTMLPLVNCVGFWEKVILPIYGEVFLWSLIPLVKPFRDLSGHRPPKPIAFGGFLLFKRETYDRIGGHERVKSSIIEDVDLARAIRWDGYRLNLLFGWPEFLTARMYFHLQHIWEGVGKSISGLKVWQLLLGAYVVFSLFVLPWLAIPLALFHQWRYEWEQLSLWILALGIGASVLALIDRWYLARTTHMDHSYPYLQPLGGLMLVAMMVNAALRVTSGRGAYWKGRHVSLDAPKS